MDVRFTVAGSTSDDLRAMAQKTLDALRGDDQVDRLSISARPMVEGGVKGVEVWEADVTAVLTEAGA